jgi:hypothetical protein
VDVAWVFLARYRVKCWEVYVVIREPSSFVLEQRSTSGMLQGLA